MNKQAQELQACDVPFHELFAQQQRPYFPGQDPNRTEQIYLALCQHYELRDPIEAMWVNDVAALTARIEYLRSAGRGRQLVKLRRMVNERYRRNDYTVSLDELEDVHWQVMTDFNNSDPEIIAEVEQDPNGPFLRILGDQFENRLEDETNFLSLEVAAVRERDRIIHQLEARRHRSEIRKAVQLVDQQLLSPPLDA